MATPMPMYMTHIYLESPIYTYDTSIGKHLEIANNVVQTLDLNQLHCHVLFYGFCLIMHTP